MSSPPASPVAASAAAAALAHLFDSPTPPRPAGGRVRPGNSALFLNSPTSSAGGGSPAPRGHDAAGPLGSNDKAGPSSSRGAREASSAAAGGRANVSRTDALALFDGLDFNDPLLDNDINGTAAGDDGLDGALPAGVGKRVIPKIDDQRLLGDQGISNLVKIAKTLKFKGKGREAEDLTSLMNHYHIWAHTLFPKSKFKDTIKTVEKVCKKRNMQSSIQRFKLEYDPPAPASPSPSPEPRTGDSPLPDVSFASSRRRSSRSASPSGRRALFSRGGSDDEADDRRRVPGRAEAVARALAATAGGSDDDGGDNEFDMDTLIRQAEEDARLAQDEMALAGGPSSSEVRAQARRQPLKAATTTMGANSNDDEDEMEVDWAELDAIDAEIAAGGGRAVGTTQRQQPQDQPAAAAPAAPPPPPPPRDEDMDDQGDWDAFDEMHG